MQFNFSADSAFSFLKKQCDFGPRIPNTPAHVACAAYLEKKLSEYVDFCKNFCYNSCIRNCCICNFYFCEVERAKIYENVE